MSLWTESPTGEYTSRVSSRQTRNFGFGQSSQSHLRLRHRPQRQRVPCAPHRLRGPAEGPSLSLRRTRGIPSAPLRARSSPFSALGSAKGAGKKYQYKHRPFGCTFWLRWVLGLSKGVSKQNKYTRLPAAGVGPGERRQKTLSPKSSAHSPYLASPLADHGLRFTPHNSRFCVGRFFLRIVSALSAVNS